MEEHSVAIAHGNAGLVHASMAIFNAFCDRCPVVVLGANSPVDAMKRRLWIDWIHTSQDMGALVRSAARSNALRRSARNNVRQRIYQALAELCEQQGAFARPLHSGEA